MTLEQSEQSEQSGLPGLPGVGTSKEVKYHVAKKRWLAIPLGCVVVLCCLRAMRCQELACEIALKTKESPISNTVGPPSFFFAS